MEWIESLPWINGNGADRVPALASTAEATNNQEEI